MKKFLMLSLFSLSFISASEILYQVPQATTGALCAIAGYKMGQKLVKGAEEAHIVFNIAYIANKISKLPKELFNKIIPGRKNDETITDIVSNCNDAIHSITSSMDDIAHENKAWVAYACSIVAGALGWYCSSKILKYGQHWLFKEVNKQ